MRNRRPARCLLYLICLLACGPGCQVLYRYRPVAVLVRDAETKKPIANADVHLCYPLTRDSLAPYDSSDRTHEDGIARLRAAPYGDFGVRVEASSHGYLAEELNVSSAMIEHIDPAHPFEAVERRRAEFVVELYAEPRFTVELVVPNGYRGLIKAEVQVQNDVAAPPGQRCFAYEVSDANTVLVKGPKVIGRIYPSDYKARYTDGTPLSGDMTLMKVGFRWLRGEGKEQYFVIGTQADYDLYRRTISAEEAPGERHVSASRRKAR
jgi:hypothetical protein